MSQTTAGTPSPSASEPSGPPVPARLGKLGPLLFQAHFGWVVALGVSTTLIPALMEQVDPEAKVALYGVLTAVGAAAGLVANILFGSLSDRTRSRFGKRNGWIAVGGLVSAASLSAMSTTSSFGLLIVLYIGYQIGLNALLAPLYAVLPDRVPTERRGLASAIIGLGMLLAQSAGAVIGAAFLDEIRTGMAIMPWAIAVTALVFAVFAKDRPNLDEPREAFSLVELARTFKVPADRDYLLALFGRLTLLLAYFSATLYQLFILQDYIKLDAAGVAGTVALAGVIMAVASGIGTLISGPLSDRIGRRKPLIILASLIIAGAFVPLALVPTRGMFLTFIALGGFAYGIYIAVDQALLSDVLPSDANHGKDMGILNVANTAPQFLAPGVAGLALASGIGYSGLFLVSAGLAVFSAFLITGIRRVR
ncbi:MULTISPECIES: MFS transporter [Actinosynnema]|uniref:MFS transporter n=1 Tax=Actinosynnema TaxID=40566 RepID=UPI0020A40101|nr:MFS transporter [Actinosynnema pretiosum]MCP2098440.1 Na+/melibiose symporter [Actinosynnema pretiosum]